jgi:CO/xanthine dehydrogenase FAD-binding subunit
MAIATSFLPEADELNLLESVAREFRQGFTELAKQDAQPFSDALASEWYRRKMVGVYVARALEEIANG